jgi:uncharacterized protein (TIGR02266 family)
MGDSGHFTVTFAAEHSASSYLLVASRNHAGRSQVSMTTMKLSEAFEEPAAMHSNRREHERVSAKFEVRFQDTNDAARALRAYSLNLSAGGLCLRTRRSYDVGSHVRLQMSVDGQDFELEGIISWVRDDAEAIGVRFLNLKEDDRLRLQRVIASFKR